MSAVFYDYRYGQRVLFVGYTLADGGYLGVTVLAGYRLAVDLSFSAGARLDDALHVLLQLGGHA